jgi:hypothetical protein
VLGERELDRRRLELLPRRSPPDAGGGGGHAHVVQPRREPDPGAGPRRWDGQPVGARGRHHPGRQVHLLQRYALELGRVVAEAADARASGRRPLERRPARQLWPCRSGGLAVLAVLSCHRFLDNVHHRQLELCCHVLLCIFSGCFFRSLLRGFLLERRELVVVHGASLKKGHK